MGKNPATFLWIGKRFFIDKILIRETFSRKRNQKPHQSPMSHCLEINCADLDERTLVMILALAEQWRISPAEVVGRLLDECAARVGGS